MTFGWSWASWGKLILDGSIIVPGSLPTHLPGLLGPAIGAIVATAIGGRLGLGRLAAWIIDPRLSALGWVAALSPLIIFGVVAIVAALMGQPLQLQALDAYPGVPRLGLPTVFVIALLANGFGE